MDIQDISLGGLNGNRSYEGRALRAYQDEVGVWTIGYGITNMDKGIGFTVGAGVTITVEQAEWLLYKSLLDNYAPAVRATIDHSKCSHPQGAQDGGLSFDYNCGAIKRATWPKKLNAGDMAGAEASLKSWNKAGGKVLTGLSRRRAWEWGMVSAGEYGHLSGPSILDQHERTIGEGELLTEFPKPPAGETAPGSVHTTGIPKATTTAPGAMRIGSSGEEVKELQRDLVALSYPIAVSGTYDEATAAVVTKFQHAHPNLTADGVAGPATRAAVTRDLAMRSKVKTIGKLGTAGAAASGGVAKLSSVPWGELALGVVVVVALGSLAYVAWQHRHEVEAYINKMIGRITL